MNKPHKHAAIIKAWADGAKIQLACPPMPSATNPRGDMQEADWLDCNPHVAPEWREHLVYRVKPEPVEWQAEREAWARGEKVQRRLLPGGPWVDVIWHPAWASRELGVEYRIAPKAPANPQPHKWQKEMDAWRRGEAIQWRTFTPSFFVGSKWESAPRPEILTESAAREMFDSPAFEFRIPHRWQREMDAHAAGAAIECRAVLGPGIVSTTPAAMGWAVCDDPAWIDVDTIEYRVKAEAAAEKFSPEPAGARGLENAFCGFLLGRFR